MSSPSAVDDKSAVGGNLEHLLASRLDDDEAFLVAYNYLNENIILSPGTTESSLRVALEDRELELGQKFLKELEAVNRQVQSFVGKIRSMNEICREMTQRIHLNKEKTRELLKKTAILQNEKKQISAKQIYLDDFFRKYSLTSDEELALDAASQTGLSDSFFKAFKRLLEVNRNALERTDLERDNLALREISQLLVGKLDSAYETLCKHVQRECRLLNVEFFDLKPTLVYSFELLQSREPLFLKALEDYGNARRGFIVRSFIDTLTKKSSSSSTSKPIEHLSTDSLRYVNEMLSWIQNTIVMEKDLLDALLRDCHLLPASGGAPLHGRAVLSNISEVLCQPLRLRIEQSITKETNCVVLYRLSSLLQFFVEAFKEFLPNDSHLILCCLDLHELCSNIFYSSISTTVQRILANSHVPDYDLQPVNSVNQALLLLRDILESQNDGVLQALQVDKREIYNKIFLHILDPLMQSVQLVCSNLDDQLDLAVYMLNCLNAIRSVIILYQFTDAKLEMIKAQIEANEDVLVSEQASKILMECDLMEIYTKAQAHQPNQGPLSKIPGMEHGRIRESILHFNNFLQNPRDYYCSQLAKVSSTRIRESIVKRTLEHVIAACNLIWEKLAEPSNLYPPFEQLKPMDEVRKALLETSSF